MKKLFTIIAISLQAIAMYAQWSTQIIKGDALAGTKNDIAHLYTDTISGGTFLFWESIADHYSIHSSKKIFDVQVLSGQITGTYSGIEVAVGLYTSQGALVEKFMMWLDVDTSSGVYNQARTRRGSKMSVPVGQGKKVKKILKHLTSSDGYVRILAPLYGGTSLDLTIPHL